MTTPAPVATNVACIGIVRDADGRVLVVARSEAPHEYAIPGGSVDEGETPEACIKRELREETGIEVLECCRASASQDHLPGKWGVVVLTSPDGRPVHVFDVWRWTGTPFDGEGPLDGSGVAKPGVTWLTPPQLLAQASKFKASVQRLLDLGCLDSQFNTTEGVRAMDLGVSDVHVPSASSAPAKKRAAVRVDETFKDAASVQYAAGRLHQQVKTGRVSKVTARAKHKLLVAAGKKHGVTIPTGDDGLPVPPAPPVAHPGPLKTRKPQNQRGRLDVVLDHPQHGRLEIRHLKDLTAKDVENLDGNARLADSGSVLLYSKKELVLCADDGDGPTWNQISTRGTFAGHGAGVFSLDDHVFADIVRNYREVDGGKVSFDFEHASEQDAASGTIPITGCPAQGWILDLKIMPDGLHALVDWLEPARTYIRERKYQFVSPAIRFGAKDPRTAKPIGARLTSVACTNQPFLRGLQPLAAKDVVAAGAEFPLTLAIGKPRTMSKLAHDPNEFMPKIKACLGLHALTTPAQCSEHLKALREMHMSGAGGVDCAAYVDKLRDALQAPIGSTVSDVFDMADKMVDACMDEHLAGLHPAAMTAGGADDAAMAAGAAATTTATDEDMTMADKTPPDATLLTSKLTEATTLLSETTTKLSVADGELVKLRLKMKDVEADVLLRDTEIATLKETNTKLLKDVSDRDERELSSRVDDAFDTYKTTKKLTDEDKKGMSILCKSDRAYFESRYPVMRGIKKVLMSDLTGGGKDVALTTDAGARPPGAVAPVTVKVGGKDFLLGKDAKDTALKLCEADRSLPVGEATSMALAFHSKR